MRTSPTKPVDARAEFRLFVEEFGDRQAAMYFAEGLTPDEARAKHRLTVAVGPNLARFAAGIDKQFPKRRA